MQLCSKPRGARGIEPETFRRRGQLLTRPPTTGPGDTFESISLKISSLFRHYDVEVVRAANAARVSCSEERQYVRLVGVERWNAKRSRCRGCFTCGDRLEALSARTILLLRISTTMTS